MTPMEDRAGAFLLARLMISEGKLCFPSQSCGRVAIRSPEFTT